MFKTRLPLESVSCSERVHLLDIQTLYMINSLNTEFISFMIICTQFVDLFSGRFPMEKRLTMCLVCS